MVTTQGMIDVTPLAAEKLEMTLKDRGESGSLLRVVVMPDPHGRYKYMMGVEKESKEGDFVIDVANVRVLVDAQSAPLVQGAKIDYVEGEMRSGFVISNLNLQCQDCCDCSGGGCGCDEGTGGCGCDA